MLHRSNCGKLWERRTVSTNVLEPLPPAGDLVENRFGPPAIVHGGRAAAAVLAPVVAAAAALALHRFLPDQQLLPLSMGWMDGLPVWGRPYPVVIETFGAAALLLAIIQWAWRPLRPWVRHHAPLLAGLLAVGALWDLITLKLNWMVLPYFPGPAQVLAGM